MLRRRLTVSEVQTAHIAPTATAIHHRLRKNADTKAAPHLHTATINIGAEAETSADRLHLRITSEPAEGSAAESDHRDLAGQKATWLHAGRQNSIRGTDLDRETRDTVQGLQKQGGQASGRAIKDGRRIRTITAVAILRHVKGGTNTHAHRCPQDFIAVSVGASGIAEGNETAATSDITTILVPGD